MRTAQGSARRKMIVKKQPGSNERTRPHSINMRQNETHRPDDMRSLRKQNLALRQRFTDKTELVVFEIPKTAMNKLRTRRRRRAGKIVRFSEHHAQSAHRRVGSNARAVDTAADHDKIEDLVRHPLPPLRIVRPNTSLDDSPHDTKGQPAGCTDFRLRNRRLTAIDTSRLIGTVISTIAAGFNPPQLATVAA